MIALLVVAGWVWRDTAQDEASMSQLVTPQGSLTDLAAITPVPGSPAVLWARLPMGKLPRSGEVPGPTDLILIAILDYGTIPAADAVLKGADGKQYDLNIAKEPEKYDWMPEPVLNAADNGALAFTDLTGAEGFGDAKVWRIVDAPQFVMLRKPLN